MKFLLWLPLLATVVILACIFLPLGTKRGPVRALISVISTLASAVAAVFASHGLAKLLMRIPYVNTLLNGTVSEAMGSLSLDTLSAYSGTIENIGALLFGVGCSAFAIVLFGLLFFLISIIVKNVVSALTKKLTPAEKTKGTRWGGALISLVDVIVYALILWLPIYGTIAFVSDGVKALGPAVSETPLDGVSEYVNDADESAIVKLYGTEPLSAAYDNIFSFRFRGKMLSTSRLAKSGINCAAGFMEIKARDRAPGFYEEESRFADSILDLLNENSGLRATLFDFASLYLTTNQTPTEEGTPDETQTMLGQLGSLLQKLGKAPKKGESEKDAIEMLSIGIIELLSDNNSDSLAPLGDVLEGLARHPNISTNDLRPLINALLDQANMETVAKAALGESILATLKTACDAPAKNRTMYNFMKTLSALIGTESGNSGEVDDPGEDTPTGPQPSAILDSLISGDSTAIATIADMMSPELLTSFGLDEETANEVAGMMDLIEDVADDLDLSNLEDMPAEDVVQEILNQILYDNSLSDDERNALSAFIHNLLLQ